MNSCNTQRRQSGRIPVLRATSSFAPRSEVLKGTPMIPPGHRERRRYPAREHALALNPLLLTVYSRLDATGGMRIFPRHFAERRAGGLPFLQGRQRLTEPQQGLGGFRRSIEFGCHRKEGFGRVTVELALEKALAQPILRIREQRIAWVFLCEVAHGFFG